MSSSSFLVERRSSLTSISEISFHRIKSVGNLISLLPTPPNVKNFQMKTRKLKVYIYIYINESYVDIDCLRWSSIPREIKPWLLMGKLHVCKSTVVGQFSTFFQCLSFQSYHVIHQQELNTLTYWREHTVKNTAKLTRKMIFFYSVSLKYSMQAHSYKNRSWGSCTYANRLLLTKSQAIFFPAFIVSK